MLRRLVNFSMRTGWRREGSRGTLQQLKCNSEELQESWSDAFDKGLER